MYFANIFTCFINWDIIIKKQAPQNGELVTAENLIILVGFGLIALGIMCCVLSYRIKEIIDFIWEIDRVLRPLIS